MTLRFAVIGTFWLCENMIKAMQNTEGVEYFAQYSRNIEKAKSFSEKFGNVKLFDNLEKLADDPDVDGVYIASPNALHFEQAKLMLEHGKHVIVEKPATVTKEQFEELCTIADRNGVIVMEAMMNAHMPHVKELKELVNDHSQIVSARFDFSQRSSKIKRVMAGEKGISTFSNDTYGGALTDLGVYGISLALILFGRPKGYTARGHFINESDVDVTTNVMLNYNGFDVMMTFSKLAESKIRSEIICRDQTITMENLSRVDYLKVYDSDNRCTVLSELTDFDVAFGIELKDFLKYVNDPNDIEYINCRELSIDEVDLLHSIRSEIRKNL